MKRSKAILLIAESLVEPRYESSYEEADFILRRLEKAGMIPPESANGRLIQDPITGTAHIERNIWDEE